MILFKFPEKERELESLSRFVRTILDIYAYLAETIYKDDIVITEIFRSGDTPHADWRAIDVAILKNGGVLGSERLRQTINILFPYGVEGYETIPDLRHGNAPHTHIQEKP